MNSTVDVYTISKGSATLIKTKKTYDFFFHAKIEKKFTHLGSIRSNHKDSSLALHSAKMPQKRTVDFKTLPLFSQTVY